MEVDSLLTQYKFCTENKSVLEAKSKQYQSQVAAKMAQVQKAYADFQQKMQNGTFTTREQAEAAQLRIQRMQQEGAKLEEQLQKRMTAEQEKFNNTLRDSLQSFLKDYNKEMGYSMIVSKQGDNVLYADPSLNLTKAVIEGMNKRYKSTNEIIPLSGTTPAGSRPQWSTARFFVPKFSPFAPTVFSYLKPYRRRGPTDPRKTRPLLPKGLTLPKSGQTFA